MAIAACPRFLRLDANGVEKQDFYLTAPPGHRYTMYFAVWGENGETRQLDWRTSDRVPKLKLDRRTGLYEQSGWEDLSNKYFACATGAGVMPPHNEERPRSRPPSRDEALRDWKPMIVALARRQSALAAPLIAQGHLFAIDAQSVAPFTTGLGNEHPLENGFAFLNPYGLPYLAGSGVKGVLRQAARELAGGEWGGAQGWTEDAITWLFGLQSGDGDKVHQRGALVFWDVMPQPAGDALQVDVMTPHQSHYYQGKSEARSGGSASPHDSGQPNPIHFLTVPPGSGFTFHVQCNLPLLRRHAPALAEGQRWQALLKASFEHAFAWLGFGAKTAVGYGAMREDERARQRREAARAAAEAEAAAAAQQARLAALSPEDRAWEEAQPVIEAFRAQLAKAKGKAYRPGGPFDEARLAFLKTALGWTEPRSRQAAGQALAETATRDWGRPSKAERWAELRATIAQLTGAA